MGRLRGWLWFLAGLVVAVLAAAVAYITLTQAATRRVGTGVGPRVPVVVSSRAVGLRSRLTADDLSVVELPVDSVPETSVRDLDAAVGKLTLVDLYPGEAILQPRLLDPNVIAPDGRLALVVSDGEVLLAFPADDLMSQADLLQPGDRIDILFSVDVPVDRVPGGKVAEAPESYVVGVPPGMAETEQVTFGVLQNVHVAAVVEDEEGRSKTESILMTVAPQDALVLKYLKDNEGIVDIVLRPPAVEEPFETEPVDIDYIINRYQIPVGEGP